MNTIRQRRSSSSTMTASGAVFLLFIMLLGGMRPPASLAASVLGISLGQLPAGTFNVQIQALEVTQGVRGDIPTRTPPGDDLVLMSDNAVHVANRRTVVRVYPWVETGSGAAVPPLTARLSAYRDGELLPGSPITPVNSHLEGISPDWTLEEMRSDAARSWNFLLPPAWVVATLAEESFALRFVVEANPPGVDHRAECAGCDDDNAVVLHGQEFVYVRPLILKPYFVDHTLTVGEGQEMSFAGPTPDEFHAALSTVHRLLPVGDGARGMEILSPTRVTWHGPLKVDGKSVFAEAMIRRYFPGGSLEASQPGLYHLFLFGPSTYHLFLIGRFEGRSSLGLAWVGKSYVQAGTYGFSLAHELTHAIGLDHAGNGHGERSFNADYPDQNGKVEPNAHGFDLWAMRAIPPDGGPEGTHDYMSYGPEPKWVSIYTWENVARWLGQPNLQVSGTG